VPDADAHADAVADAGRGWVTLATAGSPPDAAMVRRPRIFARVIAAAVVVLLVVSLASVAAARSFAESEAVDEASGIADVLADAVVQPAVADGLLDGDPAALAAVDAVVRERVLSDSIVRVKIWDATGRIVYSDEPRLIGETFELEEEELEVLTEPRTDAEVSDVAAAENRYERGFGTLLEVYRAVELPSGQPLLFETYFRYDEVTERSGELWRGFAAVTVGSILAMLLLLLPVLRGLLGQLSRAQDQRESFLHRALDSSAAERRRIAGALHDGVVQDLAATSYALSGSAARAGVLGDGALASDLRGVGSTVRDSIRGLRTLLVDIYPPSLAAAGLRVALDDLASGARSRGIEVVVDVVDPTGLDEVEERLVFRVAQECLANAVKHSGAAHVRITVAPTTGGMLLQVSDDGVGFDASDRLATAEHGHLGLRVLRDLATDAGAGLTLRTAPGRGTTWRLLVTP
jgi:two-component system NarL family sensor kinase